jgi:hypothetical protein
MSSVMNVIFFALGAYAYVDDLDKMMNRAVVDAYLTKDLERTVVAKGEDSIEKRREENIAYEREGPPRRGPGSGEEMGKPTNPIKAYKNGLMGRNRVWGGYGEAEEIAEKAGIEFSASSFFRAASSRIIDPELAMGETGYFGNKKKFYASSDASEKDVGKVNDKFNPPNPAVTPPKAPKALPIGQSNPFVRGNPTRPTLPVIRGPRAQAFRAPLAQTFADIVSIPAVVLISLFIGCGIVFAFSRMRKSDAVIQLQ